MRDHRMLRAFELADQLALTIYRTTKSFPREEQFGLTSQMRRAAVSAASNLVEGCGRFSERDYVRFVDISCGSAREVEYQLSLAIRLEYLPQKDAAEVLSIAAETNRIMAGLQRSLRRPPEVKPSDPNPED